MKLIEIKDLDIKKFIALAYTKTKNLAIAEDTFSKAYVELINYDKHYNNRIHIENVLSKRIIARSYKEQNRTLMNEKHSNSIKLIYYRKFNSIKACELNYDANVLIAKLENKNPGSKGYLRQNVFISALEDSSYGIVKDKANELGISKENYKTTLLDARRIIREFYY